VIELSDKDLKAIADSRAWEGKYFKRTSWAMLWILLAIGLTIAGYAAYFSLKGWPVEIPDVLLMIVLVYVIVCFLTAFIASYIRSKQILKQLKKERDS